MSAVDAISEATAAPKRKLTVNYSHPYAYHTVGMEANRKLAEDMG